MWKQGFRVSLRARECVAAYPDKASNSGHLLNMGPHVLQKVLSLLVVGIRPFLILSLQAFGSFYVLWCACCTLRKVGDKEATGSPPACSHQSCMIFLSKLVTDEVRHVPRSARSSITTSCTTAEVHDRVFRTSNKRNAHGLRARKAVISGCRAFGTPK